MSSEATLKNSNEAGAVVHMNEIVNFLDQARTFNYKISEDMIFIQQSEDKKTIQFNLKKVEKVLLRQDYDGTAFIQVNFSSNTKILITKNLVGFKPTDIVGFDSAKIPKVVTTVDLLSITKAIEELYDSEESLQTATEIEVLKKVFQSIMIGAESVGFDMRTEKDWFSRHLLNHSAATA